MVKINVYVQDGPDVPLVIYMGEQPQIGSTITVATKTTISIFKVIGVNAFISTHALHSEKFGNNTMIQVVVERV